MSIEYQLYSMSITNQIIIPIVGNKQSFHQQNVFVHTPLALTPRKDPNSPQPLLWKKTSSAFKKFKDKKDKKQHPQSPEAQNIENLPPPAPTRFYVLAKIASRTPSSFIQMQDSSLQTAPYGYFDPNQAPLYRGLLTETEASEMKDEFPQILRERRPKPRLKMEEQGGENRALRMSPLAQKMEQEQYIQSMPVLRDDDPFIIIRRYSRQKGMKGNKTKPIRKQRTLDFKQSVFPFQKQTLRSIIMAKKVSENSLSGSQLSLKVVKPDKPPQIDFSRPQHFQRPLTIPLQDIEACQSPKNRQGELVIEIESSPECHECSGNYSERSWKSDGRAKGIECD